MHPRHNNRIYIIATRCRSSYVPAALCDPSVRRNRMPVLPCRCFPHREAAERCPHCGTLSWSAKATTRTKKKLETVQLWRCTACARVFTPSPAVTLAVILDGITLDNLGHAGRGAVGERNRATATPSRPRSASAWPWIDEHRAAGLPMPGSTRAAAGPAAPQPFAPGAYHRQVYEYAYHRPRLGVGRKRRACPLHRRPRVIPRSGPQDLSARPLHRERSLEHRRRPPISSTARASPRAAGEPSPPGPPPSSSPPSATITGGTRRCSASCSPMIS